MSISAPIIGPMTPLGGDVAGIRTEATRYTLTAQAIQDAAAEIRRLSHESNTGSSDAVEALVNVSADVAGRLDKLHHRYETAGSALTTYAAVLENAQNDALTAIHLAEDAHDELTRATYWERYYDKEAQETIDPSVKSEALLYARRYANAAEDAVASVSAAGQLCLDAMSTRDDAARAAADTIAGAIGSDGINDGWWDNFTGWVKENAEWLTALKTVLSYVGAILAVLSLVFPILAPLALLVAGVVAVLSLLLVVAGEISLLEFGLDVLSVASLGIAAVAGKALTRTMGGLLEARSADLIKHQGIWRRDVHREWNTLTKPITPLSGFQAAQSAQGINNARALAYLAEARVGSLSRQVVNLENEAHRLIRMQMVAGHSSQAAFWSDFYLDEVSAALDEYGDLIPPLEGVTDLLTVPGTVYEAINDALTIPSSTRW